MNKKLITLLATGAVIATVAGSFAAWDTLVVESTATVTFRKPVVITTNLNEGSLTAAGNQSGEQVATKEFVITVPDDSKTNNKLTFTSSLTIDNNPVDANDYTIEILENSNVITEDTDLSSSSYTMKVTAKDTTTAKLNATNGKAVSAKVTATLENKTPAE